MEGAILMAEISVAVVMEQILAVLREAYEGPAQEWSYFTDTKPNTGLFGTLSGVNAASASRPVGGTSVAAHVHHLNFAMEATAAWITGDRTRRNWAESWRVTAVSEEEWRTLLEEFRRRYGALVDTVRAHAPLTEEGLGGALAAIAHAAYHLAAIRQKLAVLRGA